MRYAVETRIFDNLNVTVKMRQADAYEQSCVRETDKCDVYIDVFEDEESAQAFYIETKKGD